MASLGDGFWGDAARRIDRLTLPALARALAVRADVARARMDRSGVAYVGRSGPPASDEELEQAVAWWVRRSREAGAWLGGVAGLPGAIGVAPEAVARLALLFRLAQHLAVVFGVDPQTDGGRLRVGEAVADALGVVLPAGGVTEASLRELARAVRVASDVPAPVDAGTTGLVPARGVGQAARAALATTLRWTPGVGAAVGYQRGGDDVERAAWRIAASLRRAVGLRPRAVVAEAEVVR